MEQSISSLIWVGLYQLFRHHSVSFRLMADCLWQTVEVSVQLQAFKVQDCCTQGQASRSSC